MSTGCGAAGQDQEDGLSSEAQDFITRAVDKVVEGLAARLDALRQQLASLAETVQKVSTRLDTINGIQRRAGARTKEKPHRPPVTRIKGPAVAAPTAARVTGERPPAARRESEGLHRPYRPLSIWSARP